MRTTTPPPHPSSVILKRTMRKEHGFLDFLYWFSLDRPMIHLVSYSGTNTFQRLCLTAEKLVTTLLIQCLSTFDKVFLPKGFYSGADKGVVEMTLPPGTHFFCLFFLLCFSPLFLPPFQGFQNPCSIPSILQYTMQLSNGRLISFSNILQNRNILKNDEVIRPFQS